MPDIGAAIASSMGAHRRLLSKSRDCKYGSATDVRAAANAGLLTEANAPGSAGKFECATFADGVAMDEPTARYLNVGKSARQ
jgi:hypothetical protein